ncbi:MAG TPA: GNAT family N-acetyltransferase [Burkholderiales bacterium]|nr:GNAT family N-acetyltransferase [Burkholderiales bacterium]
MGSTEHALGPRHLQGCVALSKSANWNQNEADWRLMLAIGRGWGITLADGTLAASTVVLPYGGFAWVSMVLVLPEQRRQGFATRLLRAALANLEARGLTPILDATPAGREVYVQEGFRDTWGFRRFQLNAAIAPQERAMPVRALCDADWPALLALDARAFGASRERLLRSLAARLPEAALVAEENGTLAGFLLGRDGREARQLGPLVARSSTAARALLAEALARVPPPLYLDLVDREPGIAAWLESLGFEFQRPFTRMVHGAGAAPVAPGEAALVCCPAGPELG